MRVRTADRPKARVRAGRNRDRRLPRGSSVSGTKPEEGSSPSASDTVRISMMASQKSGTEIPTSPSPRATLSVIPPRRAAARVPRGIDMAIVNSIARLVSSRVTGRRVWSRRLIDSPLL
jgi:hypothetical protein